VRRSSSRSGLGVKRHRPPRGRRVVEPARPGDQLRQRQLLKQRTCTTVGQRQATPGTLRCRVHGTDSLSTTWLHLWSRRKVEQRRSGHRAAPYPAAAAPGG